MLERNKAVIPENRRSRAARPELRVATLQLCQNERRNPQLLPCSWLLPVLFCVSVWHNLHTMKTVKNESLQLPSVHRSEWQRLRLIEAQ